MMSALTRSADESAEFPWLVPDESHLRSLDAVLAIDLRDGDLRPSVRMQLAAARAALVEACERGIDQQ